MDTAVELNKKLKDRKTYIETGAFVDDEITKIKTFTDSPYLGDSMRAHLIKIDRELKTNPEKRKAREQESVDKAVLRNDKELAKEVEEKING